MVQTKTFSSPTLSPPSPSSSSTMKLTKSEREDFESIYFQLVEDMSLREKEMGDMPHTLKWLQRVMHYNVPHGKRVRGLMVPLTYKSLVKDPSEEDLKLTYILGWCVEILQASFLVADDIMDNSETRRGQRCWYKVDDMGPIAFNDSLMLEHVVYHILGKYFKDKPYYTKILDLFLDVTYKTIFGQSLDTQTGKDRDMDDYTMERYTSIVKYKTSYYTTYLPVALTMAMIDIEDPELWRKVEKITLEIGHFFQIQDDFLDCFGDAKHTGKIGTDIQDCKCSWLFVIAKESCDQEQLALLKENYGQEDNKKVETVKKLYRDLDIPEVYKKFEEESYERICKQIAQVGREIPERVFYNLLALIYKRTK